MQEVARALRLGLALALAAASPAFGAVLLGEVQVRSALGEPLDARIPFSVTEGSSADASCFALVREASDGPQMLGEGVLTIERRLGERALRVRTLAPVMAPSVTIRIRAQCPGGEGAEIQQYAVRLTARAGAAPAPIDAPAIGERIAVVAHIAARDGESLQSLAAKVYPGSTDARSRYLEALRELNPELAARGDREAIAEGVSVALPDLRSIPRRTRIARATTRVAEAGAPAEEPARRREPAPKREPAPRKPARASATSPAAAPAMPAAPEVVPAPEAAARPQKRTPAATRPDSGGYVLKLSSSEMDLSRSRQIDDRMRAQLRERLLVLDADDQVAAMLSMRHNLKQLEARVAEMQLKLDSMPASLAARAAAMQAAVAAAKPSPPAVVEKPAASARPEPPPVPAKVEPPKVEPPKVEAPKVEPPKAEPPPAKIEPPVVAQPPPPPAPAKIEPPRLETPAPKPPPAASPTRMPPGDPGLPDWLWGVAAAFVTLAALIAWWIWRRRNAPPVDEWTAQREDESAAETLQPAQLPEPDAPAESVASEAAIEIAEEVRPAIASDAGLSTRLKENSGELRRRYIEERFPEIQNRTIVLEDPASVVKGARLFYEDGALPRAVELLQFTIEDQPTEVRPWLALFEIFRLERLTGEFATLAQRFQERHGKSDYWRKVQYFGREIDPGNALYQEEPLNTLETIGPREAKRLSAGLSSVGSAAPNFDPIAENWLNAPMDFENEVLANEMRMNLMAGASLTEQDLIPNPMPALRSIEMFNVA